MNKSRKLCLLSASPRCRAVQSLQITGVKRNVLFLQRARMQKLINGSMRNVSLSGERGGPPAFGWWWKVECCMLSRWKVCRCIPSDMSCDIKLSNIACTAHGLVVLSYSPLMRRPLPESGSTAFPEDIAKKHLTL